MVSGPGSVDLNDLPDLSVILVTPGGYGTLRRTMASLRAQTIASRVEVVIVAPEQVHVEVPEEDARALNRVIVIGHASDRQLAVARAEGVRHCRAPVVALGVRERRGRRRHVERQPAHGDQLGLVHPGLRRVRLARRDGRGREPPGLQRQLPPRRVARAPARAAGAPVRAYDPPLAAARRGAAPLPGAERPHIAREHVEVPTVARDRVPQRAPVLGRMVARLVAGAARVLDAALTVDRAQAPAGIRGGRAPSGAGSAEPAGADAAADVEPGVRDRRVPGGVHHRARGLLPRRVALRARSLQASHPSRSEGSRVAAASGAALSSEPMHATEHTDSPMQRT